MVMASAKSLTCAPLIPVATFEGVKGEVPPEALRHFTDSVALYQQGKYEEAVATFEKYINEDIPKLIRLVPA